MKRYTYTKPVCAVVKINTSPLLAALSQSIKVENLEKYDPAEKDQPYTLDDKDDKKGKWWVAE